MHPNSTAAASYGQGYVGGGLSVDPDGLNGGVVAVLFAIAVGCILLLKSN